MRLGVVRLPTLLAILVGLGAVVVAARMKQWRDRKCAKRAVLFTECLSKQLTKPAKAAKYGNPGTPLRDQA